MPKKATIRVSCEEFTQLASNGFEASASLRNRLRMFWHKIECVYCRRFVRQLQKIRELLHADGKAVPMPAEMKATITRNLKDAK